VATRFRLPLAAAALALAVLAPQLGRFEQFHDEQQYAWSAGYYATQLRHFDPSNRGTDAWLNPGWSPDSYWARAMATRYVYGAALAVTREAGPSRPFSYTEPAPPRATEISSGALRVMRGTAILLAAAGFALLAIRFRWRALAAEALLLAVPWFHDDLLRGWAESPLLFGFGLCAATWGTRAFPPLVGVCTAFKLTGLGLWPLLLLQRRMARWKAILLAALTWTLLTPQTWLNGGPLRLIKHVQMRTAEYNAQTAEYDGLFVPSRYLWPFVLLAVLVCTSPPAIAAVRRAGRTFRPVVAERPASVSPSPLPPS